MRILDNAESVTKRIRDRSHLYALTYINDGMEQTRRHQLSNFGIVDLAKARDKAELFP